MVEVSGNQIIIGLVATLMVVVTMLLLQSLYRHAVFAISQKFVVQEEVQVEEEKRPRKKRGSERE